MLFRSMIDRLEGSAPGQENLFGISPAYKEITWTGLDFSAAQFNTVTSIDTAAWQAEFKLHTELFGQLAYHLPKALEHTRARLEARLAA